MWWARKYPALIWQARCLSFVFVFRCLHSFSFSSCRLLCGACTGAVDATRKRLPFCCARDQRPPGRRWRQRAGGPQLWLPRLDGRRRAARGGARCRRRSRARSPPGRRAVVVADPVDVARRPGCNMAGGYSPHRTSLIVSFGRTSPRRGRRTRPTPSCGSLALPSVPPSFKWWCRPTSTCRQGWPPDRFEAPLAFPAPPPGLTTSAGWPRTDTAVLEEAPAWLAQAAAAMHACLPGSRPSLKDSAPRACNVRGRTHSHACEPT